MNKALTLPIEAAAEGETLSDHAFRQLQSAIVRGDIAPGCRFAPRCPFVKAVCTEKDPVLKEVKPGHKVSCWLY